jgi:hypothetical protein
MTKLPIADASHRPYCCGRLISSNGRALDRQCHAIVRRQHPAAGYTLLITNELGTAMNNNAMSPCHRAVVQLLGFS